MIFLLWVLIVFVAVLCCLFFSHEDSIDKLEKRVGLIEGLPRKDAERAIELQRRRARNAPRSSY
jgi:hypothetical protein